MKHLNLSILKYELIFLLKKTPHFFPQGLSYNIKWQLISSTCSGQSFQLLSLHSCNLFSTLSMNETFKILIWSWLLETLQWLHISLKPRPPLLWSTRWHWIWVLIPALHPLSYLGFRHIDLLAALEHALQGLSLIPLPAYPPAVT